MPTVPVFAQYDIEEECNGVEGMHWDGSACVADNEPAGDPEPEQTPEPVVEPEPQVSTPIYCTQEWAPKENAHYLDTDKEIEREENCEWECDGWYEFNKEANTCDIIEPKDEGEKIEEENNEPTRGTKWWWEPTRWGTTCTEDKAACIGTVWYDTLSAAVTAAETEATVTLNKDVALTSGITVNKKFTLDLWEYKITWTVTAFSVGAGWDLTITATNLNWGIKNTAWWVISISWGWKVTINNWTLEWTSTVIWVVWQWSKLTVTNWYIKWWATWNVAAVHVRRGATADIHGWSFVWKQGENVEWDAKTMKAVYAGWEYNVCEHPQCETQNNFAWDCAWMEWWTINIDGGYFQWRLSLSNGWTYNITWWTFKLTEVAGLDCDYAACEAAIGAGTCTSKETCPNYNWNPRWGCSLWTVADMLPAGYIATSTEWEYIVSKLNPNSSETIACINDTCYTSLDNAIAGVPTNGESTTEVILYKNVTLPDIITIDQWRKVKLNLNGHTISKANKVFIVKGWEFVVTWQWIIEDTQDDWYAPIIVYWSDDVSATNYSTVTVWKNVTLKWWAWLFLHYRHDLNPEQEVSYWVTVNLNGTIISPARDGQKAWNGIYLQWMIKNPTNYPVINIWSTAIIDSGDTWIYAAWMWAWNIADWATINGWTSAMEIRAWDLTIGWGAFTSTADSFSIEANGDWTTSKGGALVVSQHSTNFPINVTINGWTFTGIHALHEEDVQAEPATWITMAVNNWTFNGVVYSENVNQFISAWTFTSDPTPYLAAGKTVVATEWKFVVQNKFNDAGITEEAAAAYVATLPSDTNYVAMDPTTSVKADDTGTTLSNLTVEIEENKWTQEEWDTIETTWTELPAEIRSTPLWEVKLTYKDSNWDPIGNVKFWHTIMVRIPVKGGAKKVYVAAKHGSNGIFWNAWLALLPWGCNLSTWEPSANPYNGTWLDVVNDYVTIYSCQASDFVVADGHYYATLNPWTVDTQWTTRVYYVYGTNDYYKYYADDYSWRSDKLVDNKITIPSKTWATFLWYYEENGTKVINADGTIIDAVFNVDSDETYTAKWSGNMHLFTLAAPTHGNNAAEWNSALGGYLFGDVITLVNPINIDEGYEFKEWTFTDGTNPITINDLVENPVWTWTFSMPDSDVVATANIGLEEYEVKFYDEDGTTQIGETLSVAHGTTFAAITKPANPNKPASWAQTYVFDKWYNLETASDAADDDTITRDTNYKAVYKEDSATGCTATVTHGTATTCYSTLKSAISAATDGDTVTLKADVSLTADLNIEFDDSKSVILDLWWYKINSTSIWDEEEVIILKWLDIEIRGAEENSEINVRYIDYYNWTLTLTSWTINGKVYANDYTDIIINGWTINWRLATWENTSKITINDWKILRDSEGWNCVDVMYWWELIVNWWTIISSWENGDGIYVNTSKCTINSWVIQWKYNWITIFWDGDEDSATLIVSGWNIKWENAWISWGWNDYQWWTNIHIVDWKISCDNDSEWCTAIYHPQDWILKIDGWEIEWSDTAVEIRSWKLIINNPAVLKSTANEYTVIPYGNGTTVVWAAVAIAQHNTKQPIDVTINGWTFIWYKSVAVTNPQENDIYETWHEVELTITGWTFEWGVVSENQKDDAEPIDSFIAWWKFDSEVPMEYCAAGKIPAQSGGKYTVDDGYKVRFLDKDGEEIQVVGVKYNDFAKAIDDPEEETLVGKLTFDNWYEVVNDVMSNNPFRFNNTQIKKDTTLQAKYLATVTFDSDGWTPVNSQTVEYKWTATVPTPAPTKEGHTFNGWKLGDDAYTFPIVTENITLKADWGTDSHTIIFNMNGHGTQIDTITQAYWTEINTPADPTAEWYTFGGWYTDDGTFENAYEIPATMPASDAEVYAKWTIKSHKVTYQYTNEITWAPALPAEVTYDYNTEVTVANVPELNWYTFSGWTPAGVEVTNNKFTMPDADVIVSWTWTVKSHTITFNMNGHGTDIPQIAKNYGESIETPATPTEAWWTFWWWYTDNTTFENEYTIPATMPDADVALYAKWTQDKYTVTFDNQLHWTAPSAIENVTYWTKVAAPSDPTETWWTFGGWYKEAGCANKWNFATDEVKGNITLYAKWTQNTYGVTFDLQWHGTQTPSALSDIVHGATISDPNYTEEVEWWTFDGWYKEAGCANKWNFATDTVTSETILYAKWLQNYTITWKNGNGDVLKTEEVAEWTIPSYGSDPVQDYGPVRCEFKSWDTTPVAVTADAIYTATYYDYATDPDKCEWVEGYKISFVNWDDSVVLAEAEYGYNESVTVPAAAPTKESSVSTDYTFAGWIANGAWDPIASGSIPTAQKDVVYKASYTESTRKYDVTFVNYNNDIITSNKYDYDTAINTITLPDDPTRDDSGANSYTFKWWLVGSSTTPVASTDWVNSDLGTIEGELTIKADYKLSPKQYTVTFKKGIDDTEGDIISTAKYFYNSSVVVPADPTRDNYTFNGWSSAVVNVTADVTYTAQWAVAAIWDVKYPTLTAAIEAATAGQTVTLLNNITLDDETTVTVDKQVTLDMDGKTISKNNIEIFKIVSGGDFTITGNGSINGPANGAAYDGKSLIVVDEWTLTFENGTMTATWSGSDGMYGVYILNGWTAVFWDSSTHTGPSITSHFAAIGTNNTTAPANITVYGGEYTANANPTNNEWWSYFCAPVYAAAAGSFDIQWWAFNGYYGISSRYANVDQDITIWTPTFAASSGTKIFVDWKTGSAWTIDRHIIATSNTLEIPAWYTWVDKGNGIYEVAKLYTITFVDEDGEAVLKAATQYADGTVAANIVLPEEEPTKAATAQYTYTFSGWSPEVADVTADATYTATYSSTVNEYTITWKNDDGGTIDTTTVAYGTVPTHEDASKAATDQYTYTFTWWTPEVVAVTWEATYTAQFDSSVNEYTITWVDGNGDTLKTEQVVYGATPAYSWDTPTKTATAQYTYTFNDTWDPAIVAVVWAATYTAQFDSSVNEYTITWVDGNGDTLKTEQVAYGATPAYSWDTPTKTATAQYTYTFNDTWDPAIVAVVWAATYTATYTTSCNVGYHDNWEWECTTTKTITCTAPDNATPNTPTEDVEWDEGANDWAAATCAWTCNDPYHPDGNSCVTSKQMTCVAWTDANANYITWVEWAATWENNQWNAPVCAVADCVDGYTLTEGVCVADTQQPVEPLVDIQPGTTASGFPGGVPNDMTTIEVVDDENAILPGSSDKIVLEQSNNIADTVEGDQVTLQNKVTTDLVSWTSKKANILKVLELTFWRVSSSANGGNKSEITSAITFNNPIKVKFKLNQWAIIWVKHNGDTDYWIDWLVTQWNVDCTAPIPDNVKYKGDIINPENGEVSIRSCWASTFVAYSENTVTPSYSWWWGWGGGSTTYSCKNLPDNAVANNKTKPSKNTNYSYSTDTSAVCTFQCKSGYVRNETTESCDAVWDTPVDDKVESTNNEEDTTPVDTETNTENVQSSGYSQELVDAYEWAYQIWITSMPTIEEARLYDGITRWELAKMMVVFMSNILWKQPVKTNLPKYRDVTEKMWWDLAGYMNKAYQYQIMGINANGTPLRYFNPLGQVSRAEFSTVLSRVLYGSKYNKTGSRYREKHIKALENSGILTNTDPNIQELRWWILLMLYRANWN